jgi:hypothetical protein
MLACLDVFWRIDVAAYFVLICLAEVRQTPRGRSCRLSFVLIFVGIPLDVQDDSFDFGERVCLVFAKRSNRGKRE